MNDAAFDARGRGTDRADADAGDASRHAVQRLRLDTRRRLLTVQAVDRLTPRMQRVVLASPELADFDSRGADDHVKLFLPPDASGERAMRDYTPRAFDREARTLTLDFALHEAGPATAWALAARPGDTLEIGGPRGSTVVPDDFDWYLLAGDETALPSIGRRLEGLRAGVPVITLVVLDDARDVQAIDTRADWRAHWLYRGQGRDDASLLLDAVRALDTPPGDGYLWIAAESKVARALRAHAVDERGQHPRWMRAAGYWRRGEAGAHENLD